MQSGKGFIAVLFSLSFLIAPFEKSAAADNPYALWSNGPSADADYFPIAVWGQDTQYASRYKAAGINLYVSLWSGSMEKRLAELRAAGLRAICDQNAEGLKYLDDPTIAGWMNGEEPDNAQALPSGGYGPPIPPEVVIAQNNAIRAADPFRPVFLNLGQGVAWDGWYGRGPRKNHPEDYLEYVKAGDIVSFDIYPVASLEPEVQGKLWYPAYGVERLCLWAGPGKPVWNCIECTRIRSTIKATPAQVRSEVWMSIIKGSRGIIYFCHELVPEFNDHALLDDPIMLAGVTALNAQILELAPVINSGTPSITVTAQSSNPAVPIDILVKEYQGSTYLFAAGMRDGTTRATFAVEGVPADAVAEVLGEDRAIPLPDGSFADNFDSYDVHLYRIRAVTGVNEDNQPVAFAISSRPNPFNPSTAIHFALPRKGHTDLALYNITGQKVRTLVSGETSAGNHSVVWDGRDDHGKPVSSGIYIARLASGKRSAAHRMALVR